LKPVLKMGGAGDPPAPVGDPPTGTPASKLAKRRFTLARTIARVPSGESPDGTGGSPVLPASHFANTLLAHRHDSPPDFAANNTSASSPRRLPENWCAGLRHGALHKAACFAPDRRSALRGTAVPRSMFDVRCSMFDFPGSTKSKIKSARKETADAIFHLRSPISPLPFP